MIRHLRMVPAAILALVALAPQAAEARTVCTVVADAATGRILVEDGDCRSRVTPASTFKIPLALMGFDSGLLADAQAPALPFRKGYPDWGGGVWQQETTPAHWMKHSVLWYSWHISRGLGAERLARYTAGFDYGNADMAGDPGRDNALERAWISSSLKIAPVEQVAFLRRLVNGQLPVSGRAIALTRGIVEGRAAEGGWTVYGKTGSAYPRLADGSFDRARGWGWFVGWAVDGRSTLVFARLDQDERRQGGSGGMRARAAFIDEWPALARRLGR